MGQTPCGRRLCTHNAVEKSHRGFESHLAPPPFLPLEIHMRAIVFDDSTGKQLSTGHLDVLPLVGQAVYVDSQPRTIIEILHRLYEYGHTVELYTTELQGS